MTSRKSIRAIFETSARLSDLRLRPRGGVLLVLLLAAACLVFGTGVSHGGVIFLYTGNTIGGGARWDAAPRTIGGLERSLDGGLRFSLQGGSFEAYRDLFTWQGGVPSVADFTTAVQQAFTAWTVPDPVSGFGTTVS